MHTGTKKVGETTNMAIMIREFVDNSFVKKTDQYDGSMHLTESDHNNDSIDPDSLMVTIEGIHAAPFVTRNNTRYMPKALKNSRESWINPYRKPLIKHHNEENGEIIGRIVDSKYKMNGTLSGTPALEFVVNIPGKEAKEAVKNGLLATTSIGIIAHDVRCSICGKSIEDENGCEEGHHRGAIYKTDHGEQLCTWDIYDMEGKELSYVVVPSDMYSQNIAVETASKGASQPHIKESLNSNLKGEQQMPEPKKTTELEEAQAKVEELTAKIADMTEAAKKSTGEIEELQKAKTELEAKVTELTESKAQLEADAKEAAELKESMEKEIADAKAEYKEALVDRFVGMREALGHKVEDIETIKSRSVDSIRDSIMDMKESLSSAEKKSDVELKEKKDTAALAKNAGAVADPTLKKPEKELKESADDINKIDLRAGLQGLFDSVFNAHK